MTPPTIEATVHFARRGHRKAVRSGPSPELPPAGRVPRVARFLALAIKLDGLVCGGAVANYAELARLGHVTRARVTQILNLLSLAPAIQEEVLFLPLTLRGRDPIVLRDLLPIAARAIEPRRLVRFLERHLRGRRSYEYYQSPRRLEAEWPGPTPDRLAALERGLDDWFHENRRGRGTRILRSTEEGIDWFMVRHGEPMRREETLKGKEPDEVVYRPARYDMVGFDRTLNELCVNARTPAERDAYRRHFGLHLFGTVQYFPGEAKYSLEPLREQGEASLVCSDVPGLEWVKLREVRLYSGGEYFKTDIKQATDVFAQMKVDEEMFPESPRLTAALFHVKFSGVRLPRSVTIRPSNVAQYLRDDDATLVEKWLSRRGFIVDRTGRGLAHDVLASA